MTLEVAMMTAYKFARTTFNSSHIGNISIDGELVVPPDTCVIAKVLLYY